MSYLCAFVLRLAAGGASYVVLTTRDYDTMVIGDLAWDDMCRTADALDP